MRRSSTANVRRKSIYERLDWFQKEAVDFAIHKGSCALYMEQGTGKTWVSFGLVEKLLSDDFEGLVVGLLNNLETTWWDQIQREFPHLNVTRDWEEYKKLPKPKLLLCHYEYLVKHIKKLARRKWTMILVDESQRIKNRASNASRAMRQLRYQSEHKYVLSGTPDDGDPIHYWAQFRFFAPEVFGDVWSDFDSDYLLPTGYMGYKRKFDTRKKKRFDKLIQPWIKVVGNEVLSLKPPRHVRVMIEMPEHVRQRYELMEQHLVFQLKEEILAAQLPITKTVKLQQIVSGFIYDEDHNTHRFSSFRTRRLRALVERHRNEQMVIFCKYVPEMEDVERTCRKMGLRVAVLRGGRKHKKIKPQLQRDFQAGLYDVAIVQLKSGVGIDLYSASIAIFYSTGHSSIDFQQAKARVYRRGQQGEVVYYYLVVKNSIDEDIQLALKEKRSVSKSILTRLKARLTGETSWPNPRRKKLLPPPKRHRPPTSRSSVSRSSPKRSASSRPRSA